MAVDPATDFGEEQQTHHGIDLEDNRQVVQVGQFPLVAGLQVDDRARGSSRIRSVRRAVMTSLIAVLLDSAAKSFGRLGSMPPPLVGTTIAVSTRSCVPGLSCSSNAASRAPASSRSRNGPASAS